MMNHHERRAWDDLVRLGAVEYGIGACWALDLGPIRITSKRSLQIFVSALTELPGRSGAVRRHVDRTGAPVFIVQSPTPSPHKYEETTR
jgi:hypothetical protein